MEMLRPLEDAAYAAKTVSFSGTAGSTGTWVNGPEGVLVWADSACYVKVGVGATATTADTPIPPYTPIAFHAPQGLNAGPWRVSAIQISASGNLYAKPLNIR